MQNQFSSAGRPQRLGRPRKSPDELRTEELRLYLSLPERQRLEEDAQAAGLRPQEYGRGLVAFRILTSEAIRREKLKERQKTEQDKLRARQRQEEKDREQALQKEQAKQLRQQRRDYVRKSAGMKQRQSASQARLKEQQQDLNPAAKFGAGRIPGTRAAEEAGIRSRLAPGPKFGQRNRKGAGAGSPPPGQRAGSRSEAQTAHP